MNPSLNLSVQFASDASDLPHRAQIRRWVAAALERDVAITVRIVDADEARALNQDYRKKGYVPNVLTFEYGEIAPGVLGGDVVICAPVVAREARAQGQAPRARFAHLAVHGALHLQGYDHERAADAARMEARERRILARLGFPDPHGRRAG